MKPTILRRIRALEERKSGLAPPVMHIVFVSPNGEESEPYLLTENGLVPSLPAASADPTDGTS